MLLTGFVSIVVLLAPPVDEPLTARVGSRVRITAPSVKVAPSGGEGGARASKRFVGTIISSDQDQMGLRLEDGEREVMIPVAAVEQLDVSRGMKTNVTRGALIGATVGLVGVLAANYGESGTGWNAQGPCDYGLCVIVPAAGAGVGALVGLAVKSERWARASSRPVDVVVLPLRQGVQIALVRRY